jgi:hypothetical protein
MTDDDIAYYAKVNRKCAEINIELKAIKENVEKHGKALDALCERADKVFAQIDELYAGRLV